jgi:hypothetical protein
MSRASSGSGKDPAFELGYRFSIQTDANESSNPLKGKRTVL